MSHGVINATPAHVVTNRLGNGSTLAHNRHVINDGSIGSTAASNYHSAGATGNQMATSEVVSPPEIFTVGGAINTPMRGY